VSGKRAPVTRCGQSTRHNNRLGRAGRKRACAIDGKWSLGFLLAVSSEQYLQAYGQRTVVVLVYSDVIVAVAVSVCAE